MCAGESDSQGGLTALMRAAESGHAGCVRLLIDAGTDKCAKHNVRVGCSVLALFSSFFSVFIRILLQSFP